MIWHALMHVANIIGLVIEYYEVMISILTIQLELPVYVPWEGGLVAHC
jgi:hypothetical protein